MIKQLTVYINKFMMKISPRLTLIFRKCFMDPLAFHQKKLAVKLLAILLAAVFVFGCIYLILNQFQNNGLKSQTNSLITFWDCIYFSIVTMSTLGYGDIVPIGLSRLLASIEAIFGLAFVGYAISQVVSAKQEALIEYLAKDRIVQTYDECLAMIKDAKELIADRRRLIQTKEIINHIDFIYNRSNPFYPALRAMETLNGYTAHIEETGNAITLAVRIERAAHHVEELASFTRKYVNLLISGHVNWQTPRTKQILIQLCDEIDLFSNKYVIHTRFATQEYKGSGLYKDIVCSLTNQIRSQVANKP